MRKRSEDQSFHFLIFFGGDGGVGGDEGLVWWQLLGSSITAPTKNPTGGGARTHAGLLTRDDPSHCPF